MQAKLMGNQRLIEFRQLVDNTDNKTNLPFARCGRIKYDKPVTG